MFSVDKNVSFVEAKVGMKYPWSSMGVGDSFMVPCSLDERKKVQATLCASAPRHFGKGNYRTASVEGGIRIWRTA